MATLFFVTHPEVVVDPATPVERWHLAQQGIDRMRAFAASPLLAGVTEVWASTEARAIEAAGLLAGALGCGVGVDARLGENDRRATGFLPPAEFESVADAFFAQLESSVRGWERAIDAQRRIVQAVAAICDEHHGGDLAIVAHGAVGTLLLRLVGQAHQSCRRPALPSPLLACRPCQPGACTRLAGDRGSLTAQPTPSHTSFTPVTIINQ